MTPDPAAGAPLLSTQVGRPSRPLRAGLVLGLLALLGAGVGLVARPKSPAPAAPLDLSTVPLAPGCTRPTHVNTIGMRLMQIPKGSFVMGLRGEESAEPLHPVTLTRDFYLGATEVTQAQFEAVMGRNPSHFDQAGPRAPVECVNLVDAQEFCRRLSEREGRTYRLPTEAEWEYAARAGASGPQDLPPRGSGVDPHDPATDAVAWYCGNSGVEYDGADRSSRWEGKHAHSKAGTHPVGQKKPNAWGLYDMLGNVGEWCADFWGDYPEAPQTDPCCPGGPCIRTEHYGTARKTVVRGGTYENHAIRCLPGQRSSCMGWLRLPITGFRVVMESTPAPQAK